MAGIWVAALLGGMDARETSPHEPVPHGHQHPFIRLIEDYHVRLGVDHRDERIFLIFEDTAEKPTRLVRLKSITGKAKLTDGRAYSISFLPTAPLSYLFTDYHRHIKERLAGLCFSTLPWVRHASRFVLEVSVPFRGRLYRLSFDYDLGLVES